VWGGQYSRGDGRAKAPFDQAGWHCLKLWRPVKFLNSS
jgi:hypothetical protein